jgi:hypothetical protein
MAKLTDLLKAPEQLTGAPLPELFIKQGESELVKLFTEDVEIADLHYETHEVLRGSFHCLGVDCPYCTARKPAAKYYLIPVYSVGSDAIAVLKVPATEGPYKLLSQIRRFFDDPSIASKIIEIRRDNSYNYFVDAMERKEHESLGATRIAAFVKARDAKLVDLGATWRRPTAEDMRAVPNISLKLAVLEGTPSPSEAAFADTRSKA